MQMHSVSSSPACTTRAKQADLSSFEFGRDKDDVHFELVSRLARSCFLIRMVHNDRMDKAANVNRVRSATVTPNKLP